MTVDMTTNQPVVRAGRFVLRPLRASDAGLIELNAGDARVATNTSSIPHPLPPGATDALIARAAAPGRTTDVWAMDASASGGAEVMGLISLARKGADRSDVDYWVAPAYWNTGIASAALSALVAANPQGVRAMRACVFQDNAASARVLTHCGFDYLGDSETFSVARGATVPTWTYSRKLD